MSHRRSLLPRSPNASPRQRSHAVPRGGRLCLLARARRRGRSATPRRPGRDHTLSWVYDHQPTRRLLRDSRRRGRGSLAYRGTRMGSLILGGSETDRPTDEASARSTAEGVGFEPTVAQALQRFSRPPRSSSPAPLHQTSMHPQPSVPSLRAPKKPSINCRASSANTPETTRSR